jgi:hypothetical protein
MIGIMFLNRSKNIITALFGSKCIENLAFDFLNVTPVVWEMYSIGLDSD